MKTFAAVAIAVFASADAAGWQMPRPQWTMAVSGSGAAAHAEPKKIKSMAQLYVDSLPISHSKPSLTQLYSKPKELLPIGEGAYQSAEAVAQRTTDSAMDCEEGNVHGCYHKDGADFVDGHSYGHLQAEAAAGVKVPELKIPELKVPDFRSGALPVSPTALALAAVVVGLLA
eukprot:CAMPEP_0177459486 /NCGR_PEP_ID=MMETSP0369-20130122/14135_1 /TAXON_ID=447022 ORGANISM="Scrippsiella hangoei-like, Strain SHHI-4" /NCGR_SAMPLE_ID=MMETSP0369 /ASSEMBLY_ACC=CAM_ASM_000364 /LENGTH=171 /DNA_ID=CAMNT_0018932765 /DNA_START=57 /DNA_END=572 /DNA_ORIENTATION=-